MSVLGLALILEVAGALEAESLFGQEVQAEMSPDQRGFPLSC